MNLPDNEIKIKIRDLSLYYQKVTALSHITMDVEKNQITSLIGPSGSGKSSLLRCLNRLNDMIEGVRIEGDILFEDGYSIYDRKTDLTLLRRRVGMVFQKPNLFPKSIKNNIAFGVRVSRRKKKDELEYIIESSLKKVGLWKEVNDRLDKPALSLSGGQAQRLCIARAIAVQPEVILMDEPTSSLDPIASQTIEELILELKESYTVMIVTHNMQQAARISDVTAFLYDGRLVEINPTNKFFTNPENDMTEKYITGRFG